MKIRKAIISVLLVLCICVVPTACSAKKTEVKSLAVLHEPEFGGVYIKITIDEFNSRGFEYGDSVDVAFSNGYVLKDIPYYNGYYVDSGEPLLIAYPGYDYIKAAVNYGDDLWVTSGIKDTDTATVTLAEHGKYKNVQEARDISYSDERSKYTTDEEFANFRCVTVGNIKDDVFYRSASPCDNQHNRAPYVDDLIEKANVSRILDLADSESKIEGYISAEGFDSPYFLSLYKNGKVIPLAMSMNYNADDFKAKIAAGFTALAQDSGSFLVHCTEGKDRTGFMCMLLEALAGASYQEIVDDYMITYDNYYKITEKSDKTKYDTILEKNLVAMIKVVVGDSSVDITKADLSVYAKNFLIGTGMKEADISELVKLLTE